MALKTKKKTLADKITSLITTTPVTFASDDEVEDTAAKVVEHYDENFDSDDNFDHSKIRRQNVETLDQTDERYAGKKVSRKDIYEDSSNEGSTVSSDNENISKDTENQEADDLNELSDNNLSTDEDESDSDNENENIASDQDMLSHDDEADESNLSDQDVGSDNDEAKSEEDEDEDEDVDEDEEYAVDIGNPLYRNRDADTKFKTMSDTNVKADIEKGNSVRSQLKLWEGLLEMRIKLQKCLVASNQMPQHNVHKDYRTDIEFMKKTNETKNKLGMLLNNMLQLQSTLLSQYPETKNLHAQNKKRKMDENAQEDNNEDDPMDEEIPSDTEDENEKEEEPSSEVETEKSNDNVPRKKLKLASYEKLLQENHKSYVEYRNSVIQKWNEKTRIATGNLNKGMSQTTLKQIEFALNDKQKLHRRTQLKRSEYTIVGKPEAPEDEDGRRVQEYDPEIYDDDDFYHQLLRDLIEYKSSGVTDPIQLSKQWIQLQNMRSKMKRKIDTRATKGRRIRYNVHNKLVNFMAPITVNDTWTDHAKNELYNSLFGKIKPTEEVVR